MLSTWAHPHGLPTTLRLASTCLHIPQTKVCLLRTETLGSLNTSHGIVVCLHNSQTEVCPLRADVPYWLQPWASLSVASHEFSSCLAWLSVFPYVFIVLKPKSIRCVLGLVFCLARPSIQQVIFVAIKLESVCYLLGLAQYDSRYNHLSSQPSERSLSATCQDFAP